MRVGFVTGPEPVTQRIVFHQMVSSMHVSGLSQVTTADVFYNKEGKIFFS